VSMPDQPAKKENAELIQALAVAGETGAAESWKRVYRLLMESPLCIPVLGVPELAASEPGSTGKALNISVVRLKDSEGRPVTLAFTDEEALHHWRPYLRGIRIPGRQFFGMVKQTDVSGVLINFHDHEQTALRPGGRLTRFEIEALAQGIVPARPDESGRVEMTVSADSTIEVNVANELPSQQVLDALSAAGRTMPDIKQLYVVELTFEGEEPHNVIGVELLDAVANERWQAITRGLADSVNKLLKSGSFLEFVRVEGALGEAIQRKGKPLLN
jgi:SseB protein N-terminal domain/SseB protein C-terminal domain